LFSTDRERVTKHSLPRQNTKILRENWAFCRRKTQREVRLKDKDSKRSCGEKNGKREESTVKGPLYVVKKDPRPKESGEDGRKGEKVPERKPNKRNQLFFCFFLWFCTPFVIKKFPLGGR